MRFDRSGGDLRLSHLSHARLRFDPLRGERDRGSRARPLDADTSLSCLRLRLSLSLGLLLRPVLGLRLLGLRLWPVLGLRLRLRLHPRRLRSLPLLVELGLAFHRPRLGFGLLAPAADTGQALKEANLPLLRGKSKLRGRLPPGPP